MKLIVTDFTDMSANNYCIAGWDVDSHRMVRPLPDGHHWTLPMIQQNGVFPGAIVEMTSNGMQHNSSFPHFTEDFEVASNSIALRQNGPFDWFNENAPATSSNINSGFGGNVQCNKKYLGTCQGVHVPEGTQTASLCAVQVNKNALRFVEVFEKLKVEIDDGNAKYEIAVSCHMLKAAWAQGGVHAVQNALPHGNQCHVRIGLARAWDDHPDKCYMMLNGVHG